MNTTSGNPYSSPSDSRAPDRRTFLHTVASVFLVMIGATLFFLAVFMSPFAWLLRDGLGPDSTTSFGWNAITRTFWCFYWGPATLSVASVYALLFIFRRMCAAAVK